MITLEEADAEIAEAENNEELRREAVAAMLDSTKRKLVDLAISREMNRLKARHAPSARDRQKARLEYIKAVIAMKDIMKETAEE